ncbi:hypothetical protein MMC21_002105 [Puttea exsequens]|nr:hypothetical protein [Puttea exsequens]
MRNPFSNPFAFRPTPVTTITSFVYIAILVSLLVVHHTVPEQNVKGTNSTEAWLDLDNLSNGFHPYNSHRNDEIRDWLLQRIDSIVAVNSQEDSHASGDSDRVVIFSDTLSNVSFSEGGSGDAPGISVYFEGTNIVVYIRGSEDDPSNWYLHGKEPEGRGGVLINAHYDSVSAGFGATDDGVGIVTILQIIKYFTSDGHQPKRGIVTLLNNGEEDFLNGAMAFSQHPMSKFVNTFLNLEGAGAGGRATLFRSTDTEVTRFYQGSKSPFGSVVSSDAFKRGVIRSETDYSIFDRKLGLRGLDVAFMEPRSRYHTDQDDARHTGTNSLNHMLSAALSTMEGLTSDTSSTFNKLDSSQDDSRGHATTGVWFDLFGRAFAVFRLRTLFALSVTLLVMAPVTVLGIIAILYELDKCYLFSASKHHHHEDGDDSVATQGWRGLFRWPITFVVASAAVIGLAFLQNTVNPYILYSSPYSVWSMMISAWVFLAWIGTITADYLRPSALQRTYTLLWSLTAGWAFLVATTVFERNPKIAGGYLMMFYFACIYLATTVSLLEIFALPKKSDYADAIEEPREHPIARSRPGSISSRRLMDPSEEEIDPEDYGGNEDDEPTESTSLLGEEGQRTTFKRYSSPHRPGPTDDIIPETKTNRLTYGAEQPWSRSLPSSLWFLEFLLLAPFPLIILGQIALLLTSATAQTLSDGNSPLFLYLLIAILTVLLFAPLGPFLHRYTYQIPTFLLLVFVGTAIYNMVAFPFSPNNRMKVYFLQRIDLENGINDVSLTGVDGFVQKIAASLPSSAGQKLSCDPSSLRRDLTECKWAGLVPNVVPEMYPELPVSNYSRWLSAKYARYDGETKAQFAISGKETRACKLIFNRPISGFSVQGAGDDKRFQHVSSAGSRELRLWSRTWGNEWVVDVDWEAGAGEGKGLDGRVVCLWSDANQSGTIPALDEAWRFAPTWAAIANNQNGLVEGSKAFFV